MNVLTILQFVAGVGAFLFSLSLTEESVKRLSGRAFKKFLQRQTSTRIKALMSGTLVTAVLQSSSVVVLMTLSFVGAGVIPLRNALAVVLGANLGTTVNSWFVALFGFSMNLGVIIYPFFAFSLLVTLILGKNESGKHAARFFVGTALLFVGLDWMKTSASVLEHSLDLRQLSGYSPYVLIPIGFVVTAILQSSGAVFAITLTALQSNFLALPGAAAIVIGAELGTTIKVLVGSLTGNGDQKRLAVANFGFNLAAVLVTGIFLYPILNLLHSVLQAKDPFIELAFFQTCINLLSIVIFFPWLKYISVGVEKLFRANQASADLDYIKHQSPNTADGALALAEQEMIHFLNHGLEFNRLIISGQLPDEEKGNAFQKILKSIFNPVTQNEAYRKLKEMHGEILDYLIDLSKEESGSTDFERCSRLINASRHILIASKDIKDVESNIEELRNSSNDELFHIYNVLQEDELKFANQIKLIFIEDKRSISDAQIAQWKAEIKQRQMLANDNVYKLLGNHSISQINASTLLNMHRAVYSAHRAILNALHDMYSKPEN